MINLKKIILCAVCAVSISASMSVTGFADWKCDSTGWWYSEGSSWSTGWRSIDNEWYLFDSSGYMLTGWAKTDNKWYYLNESGAMAHDCKIGQYELGSDGAMIEKPAENQNTSNAAQETTAATQGTAEADTEKDKTSSTVNPDMVSAKFTSSENQDLEYWLSTPKNPDNKKMPLIIYLHGYWPSTTINLVIENDGLPKYVYDKTIDVPAYVLCPCASNPGWAQYSSTLKELIADLVSKNNIDPDKISLTGHSMGGKGVWDIGAEYPELFSCIAPVSGYIVPDTITKDSGLNKVPVWTIVGDKDTLVDPNLSIDAVKDINNFGGNAKISHLKDADHIAAANSAYTDKDIDILNWMMSQTKKSK